MIVRRITTDDVQDATRKDLYETEPGILRGDLRTKVRGETIPAILTTTKRVAKSAEN